MGTMHGKGFHPGKQKGNFVLDRHSGCGQVALRGAFDALAQAQSGGTTAWPSSPRTDRLSTACCRRRAAAGGGSSGALEDQRQLYNAALEERIDCYRKTGKGRTYFDQCKALTECRRDLPEMAECPVAIQR